MSEPRLNLADDHYVLPDILVHAVATRTPDVRGPAALLIIEIAETSLDYDLLTKAALFAGHGVPEYWVVSARTLATTVHLKPTGAKYGLVSELPASSCLVPSLAPMLAVTLADLDLD